MQNELAKQLHLSFCFSLPDQLQPNTAYHLLPINPDPVFYRERVDRNIGWITEQEQQILKNSVVGIAGCGGMGGQLAEKFLRLGIGEIRIADIESFDTSNINRQFAATRATVGKSKAFETARIIRDISDDTALRVYPQGICEESVDHFLEGCDVVCDEIEFWAVGARVLLHQRARIKGISIFNCNTVGFSTRLFFFTSSSATMEDCLGLNYEEAKHLQEKIRSKQASLDEIKLVQEAVITGLVPELPEYRPEASKGDHWVVRDRLFNEGKATIIATNPPMATGFLADRVLFYLLRNSSERRVILPTPPMPGYLSFDAATMEAKCVTQAWWNKEVRS